jgi:glycopeptide antibiotics resistance protein
MAVHFFRRFFRRYILGNIRWLTGIYLLILLLGSLLPLNNGTSLNNTYIVAFRSDYFLHFLMMLPLPVLLGLTFRQLSGTWLRVLLLGLLVVVFCEGIQLLIPYRSFNINDMFANGLGAMLGLIPAWLLWRSFST